MLASVSGEIPQSPTICSEAQDTTRNLVCGKPTLYKLSESGSWRMRCKAEVAVNEICQNDGSDLHLAFVTISWEICTYCTERQRGILVCLLQIIVETFSAADWGMISGLSGGEQSNVKTSSIAKQCQAISLMWIFCSSSHWHAHQFEDSVNRKGDIDNLKELLWARQQLFVATGKPAKRNGQVSIDTDQSLL